MNSPSIYCSCGFAVLLALGACQELPDITYETEHLRIGTDFNEPLCQGDLDDLEALVTALEVDLDTTVDEPIELYIWAQADPDPSSWCEDFAQGCYRRGAIYADEQAVDHELVHAVVDTFASPAKFWNEGAAESLASTRTFFSMSACNHPELPSSGAASWSETLDVDCGLAHVYGGSLSMLAKRVCRGSTRSSAVVGDMHRHRRPSVAASYRKPDFHHELAGITPAL